MKVDDIDDIVHAALYRAEFNLFKTPCKFYSSDPRKDQVYISPGLFELLKSKQSQLDNLSRKEFTKLEVVHKAKSSQSFESLPGLLASSTTTRRLGFVYRPALATYDHVMELLADLPLISPTCTDNGKYFTLEEVSIQKRHISVQWNVLNILGEIEHHFLPILELYKDKLDIKKEFLYCRLEGLFSRYQELFKELEIIVECFDADTKAYSKSYLTEEKLNHLHVLRSWINIFRKSLFQLLDSLSPLFYHHHHLHNVNSHFPVFMDKKMLEKFMWYFVTSSPASFLFEIMDLWLEGNLYSYFISETGLKTGSCPKKFEEDLTLNPFTGFKRPLLSEDLLRIVKLYGKISHELRTIKDEDTLGRINLTSTNEEGATFISCEVFTKVLKGIFKMNLFLHAHVVLKVILSRAKKNQLVIYESSPFEEETGTNGLETGYSEIEYLKGEKDFIIIPKKVLIYFMAKSTQLLIDGTKCADSRQNSRKRELATQLENVMIELLLLQDNEITTKVFFIFMRSFFSNSAMFELANDFWPFFLVSLSPSENHESNYFSKGIRGSKSILIRISGSESFFQSKKLLSLMLEKMFSGGQTALEFLRTDMLFILFQEILLFSRKEIPNLGLFEEFVFALFRKMMTQLHALLGSELKDILEKFPNLSDKENESFQAALNPPINISFSNIPMSIFSMALLKSPHILALLNRLTSHDPRNIDTSRSIMNYFPSSVQYLERLEIILWPFLAELPTRELRLYLLCALLGQVPRFSALTSFASVKKQQCLFNFSAKNKPFCLLPLNPKKHNYYWMYYVAVKIPQSFDAFVWKNNAFRAFMGSDLEGAESVRDDFVLILLKIIPQQKSYPEYIFLATRMLNVYLPALTKLSSSSLDYQINYSSPKELYMSSYETYLKEIQSFDIKSATSNTSTETDFDIAILYKYLQPSFYPFIKLTLDNIFKKLQDFTKEPRLLSEFKDVHYFYIYGLILTNFKFSANSLAIYHIFHWLLFQINNQKEIPGTKCQAQEGYCKSTVYRRLSSDFSVIKESSHYFEHCLLTTSFVDVFLEHFIAWNDWYGVAELFSRLYRVPEFSSSIPTLKKQYLNLRNNQEDFLLAGLDSRDTFYKVIMATLHHIAESSSVDVILDSIPDFWTLQALESYLLSFFTTSTSNFYRYSFPDRLQSRSHLISILNPTNSNTDKLQGLAAKLQDSIPLQRLEGARAAIITLFNELARRRLRTVRDIRAISQNNIQLLAQQSLAPDLLIIWNGAVNVDPRLVQLRQLVLKTRPHILTFK